MSDDKVLDSLMRRLTKRVEAIAKEDYDIDSPVKTATEVIWGLMHLRGDASPLVIADMRYAAVKETKKLSPVGTARATESVDAAVDLLHRYGFIEVAKGRATLSSNPPTDPDLAAKVNRRWLQPKTQHKLHPRVRLPSIIYAGPADLVIKVGVTEGYSSGHLGYVEEGTPLGYAWDIRDAHTMAEFGSELLSRQRLVKKVLGGRAILGFHHEDLGSIRLSGDPLGMAALAVIAWVPRVLSTPDSRKLYIPNIGAVFSEIQDLAEIACVIEA